MLVPDHLFQVGVSYIKSWFAWLPSSLLLRKQSFVLCVPSSVICGESLLAEPSLEPWKAWANFKTMLLCWNTEYEDLEIKVLLEPILTNAHFETLDGHIFCCKPAWTAPGTKLMTASASFITWVQVFTELWCFWLLAHIWIALLVLYSQITIKL